MGNHDVGRGMSSGARGYWRGRGEQPTPSPDEALAALDDIVGGPDTYSYRGSDAEFDDEISPDTPLGRLVAIAFRWDGTPRANETDEDKWDRWYETVERPFRDRYRFC